MNDLFLFPAAVPHDSDVEAWLQERAEKGPLGGMARRWFEAIRACGENVRELLHDGHPTACVGEAAFAYVNVFKAHVNVGFFRGAELEDPMGLLEGSGKLMRHVKLRPEFEVDSKALMQLIKAAYHDMKARVQEPKIGG